MMSSRTVFRVISLALVGFVSGTVYAVLVGLLSIRAQAVREGAVLDLANQIVGIVEPNFPLLQYGAIAMAGAAVLYATVYYPELGERRPRWALMRGTLLACVVVVVWASMIDADYIGLAEPYASGLRGWIQFGGRNHAVHLVILILCGALLRLFSERLRKRAKGGMSVRHRDGG